MFCSLANLYAQNFVPEIGLPLVHNFLQQEYEAASQNWAIAQSPNGFIYVGNNDGVLEFDGKNWELYRTDTETTVKSLAINNKGEIFVGTEKGLGMLKPDSTHTLHYVSLVSQIPKEKSNFTDVWQTFVKDNKVYFRTSEYLFIFKDKKLEKILEPTDRFHTAILTNNTLYIKDHKKGVLKLNQNDELEPIANQPVGLDNIYGAFYENDELTVFSRPEGIFSVKNKTVSFAEFTCMNILNQAKAYSSIELSKNQLAIGTLRNGVFITDKKGNILLHLNEENILTNNVIYGMFLDKDKNLWLATDNGISCIYLNIPYSIINASQGIDGKGLNITYSPFYQKIYIGTTTGIYQNDFPQKIEPTDGTQKKYRILEATEGYALSVLNQNKVLYYGHNLGVIQINNEIAQFIAFQVRSKVTWKVEATEDSLKFLKLHNKGIGLFTKNENKDRANVGIEKIYTNFDESIRELVQHKKYWWTSNNNNLFRLTFSESYDSLLEIKLYGEGFENGILLENRIYKINDKIYFANGKNIYEYQEEKDEFVESTLSSYFKGLEVNMLTEDEKGNIWYHIGKEKANKRGVLWKQKSNNSQAAFKDQSDFTALLKAFPNLTTNILPNQKLAIGVEDGFVIVDGQKEFKSDEKISVNIRKVEFLGESDSLLFGGVFFGEDSLIINNQSKKQELKLEHSLNALRFSFASPYPIFAEKTEYRYKLEELEDKWLIWSEKNQKEYTNLPEGKYKFVVQARNIWGIQSEQTAYRFEIYPPLYRTWWAYTTYFLLLVVLIYLIVKLNTRRLKQDKAKLENLVKQRTAQLEQQNKTVVEQSEALLYQNNNIRSSISYASRIQQAILPPIEEIKNNFNDAFVFWLPRDVVSGDFYWFAKVDNKVCIAAIDCTGHGVPGAFMSMIGNDLLNQIIIERKITEPSQILSQLHFQVVNLLRQNETKNRDGMDMAICIYDQTSKELVFAGAKNPLYYVQNGELKDITGSKQPIGGQWDKKNEQLYKSHTLLIEEETTFFICTDGYQDQFGGEKNKKMMRKRMKSYLLKVADLEGEIQKQKLENYFLKWKQEEEQINDVLVIGFKVGKKL